jgi:hypothetical protein
MPCAGGDEPPTRRDRYATPEPTLVSLVLEEGRSLVGGLLDALRRNRHRAGVGRSPDGEGRAARKPTRRYWKAFGVTLAAQAIFLVVSVATVGLVVWVAPTPRFPVPGLCLPIPTKPNRPQAVKLDLRGCPRLSCKASANLTPFLASAPLSVTIARNEAAQIPRS